MTYRGKIQNGVVVLEGREAPPDGASVSVRVLKGAANRKRGGRKRIPTLNERLAPFIGMGEGLPSDASMNIDHYLYGAPKQK